MFDIWFPPTMILAPAAVVGLWCWWTGVRGLLPLLLATLGVLVAWGAYALAFGPHVPGPIAFVVLFGLLWGFGIPVLRRAFAALPDGPRAASLKPRELRLFRAAFVWPWAAWAAMTLWMVFSGGHRNLAWLGPLLGLVTLAILKPCLRAAVREPEPLGGADPVALAERYARFRRRRTLFMYWLSVAIALLATASWGALFRVPAGGAIVGPLIGVVGALFGTWADAQRYLLRRQLAGAEPPSG